MDEPVVELYRYKNLTEFREALDTAPLPGTVKQRNLGGSRTSDYIPISVVEAMADIIFREWWVFEEKPLNTGNGIAFTVKIQGLPDYPGSDYMFFTGSGAVPFQDKANAVEYNLPAARSKAICNAFGELGNIFGRNVARSVNNTPVGSGFTMRTKKEEEKEQEKSG